MPRGNGTGPMGLGPMTGRAAGYCAGYGVPGYRNPYGGRALQRGFYPRWGANPFQGFGMGRGRGFGRGRGRGFAAGRGWGGGYPPIPRYRPYATLYR